MIWKAQLRDGKMLVKYVLEVTWWRCSSQVVVVLLQLTWLTPRKMWPTTDSCSVAHSGLPLLLFCSKPWEPVTPWRTLSRTQGYQSGQNDWLTLWGKCCKTGCCVLSRQTNTDNKNLCSGNAKSLQDKKKGLVFREYAIYLLATRGHIINSVHRLLMPRDVACQCDPFHKKRSQIFFDLSNNISNFFSTNILKKLFWKQFLYFAMKTQRQSLSWG